MNPSPAPGSEARFTERQWAAGPNTELYHLGGDDSDSHRSTSSDPPSVPPIRTLSQAYSHSPPPTPRKVPQSKFHQPKREQSPPERDLPLGGTVEAPVFEDRVRRPEPPPPKKSRIEFGTT